MADRVIVTERAARDLEETTAWWARERSAEQAFRWYAAIRRRIESLANNPERYGLAAESDEFPYHLREMHFGLSSKPTHRALFTIVKQIVVVLSIRHVAQGAVQSDDFEPLT